jgi:protein TonB
MDKPVEKFVEKTLVAAPVPAESVVAALPGSPTPAIARGQAVVTQETVKTSEPDLQAAYKENPKPPYPKAAFRIGAEGTVEINVEVNPDGSVAAVKLAQSSGNEWLDQSALDTVKGWRFRSARRDGVLSKSFVRVPITFRLRAAR